MQLGLSSAAAPDATVRELIDACAARGLGVLELRGNDAHGIDPMAEWSLDVASALAQAAAAGVRIAGWRSGERQDALVLAHLSRALGAPVLTAAGGVQQRIEHAAAINSAGGKALVVVRGDARTWHDEVVDAGVDFVWEIDSGCTSVATDAAMLLSRKAPQLRQIRMIGGGPETAMHDGRGIGSLMGTLALAGFAGAVILAPSSSRYHVAWATWLGRRGGWGCGSKASDPELVAIPMRTSTGSTV